MKYAFLARCPVIGGKVTSFDDSDARKVPGVTHVEKVGDSAVAVAADSVFAALQGRKALKVTWDDGPNRDLSTAAIFDVLRKAAGDKSVSLQTAGDVSAARGRRIEAIYELPMLAHAPMEPENCFAHYLGTVVRSLGAHAGPAGRARLRGHRRWTEARERPRERHAAGWRFRPPPRARLRGRSGASLESHQRSSQGHVDARRRHAFLHLSSAQRASRERGSRRAGLAGGVLASAHLAHHLRPEGPARRRWHRSRPERRSCRSFIWSPTSASSTSRRHAPSRWDGCARSTPRRWPSPARAFSTNSPSPPARTPCSTACTC